MSTQTNTIPAIRALVWERWRVMRWVLMFPCLIHSFVAFALSFWIDPETGSFAAQAEQTANTIHRFMFIVVLCGAYTNIFGYTQRSEDIKLRIPAHHLRLPVSSTLIGSVHFCSTLMAGLLLFTGFYAIDYAFLQQSSMAAGVPLLQLALILIAFTAMFHAGLVLVTAGRRAVPIVIVAAIAVALVPGMWHLGPLNGPSLASRLGVVLFAAILSVVFTSMARTQATARHKRTLSLLSLRWRRVPDGGSVFALAWYEWHIWGVRYFVTLAITVLITWGVVFLRDEGDAPSDVLILGLLMAWGLSAAMVFTDQSRLTPFQALRPISTPRLAMSRLASLAALHLPVGVIILCVTAISIVLDNEPGTIAAYVQQYPWDIPVVAITVFLAAWLGMSGYFFTLAVAMAYLMFEASAQEQLLSDPSRDFIVLFTIPSLIVAIFTVNVLRRNVVSWRAISGIALVCAAVAAICAGPIASFLHLLLHDTVAIDSRQYLPAAAFLILYYPIIRRLHSFDGARTNMAPTQFGGEKWEQ